MNISQPETGEFYSPKEMMKLAESYALSKAGKSTGSTISLAIMAGAFIGLAFTFYVTVTTGSTSGWGLTRFMGGLCFSMGLILVILCGAELFTSSMLSAISWANRQISTTKMLAIWGKVYVGNLIGSLGLLVIVLLAGLYQLDGGQWGLNALNIAQHKLHHTQIEAFSLGVLCNLLVCLAVWMTFSASNAMTKAVMTILPVAMFVSTGFEHSVANMFMVPLGIAIHSLAPDSFWLALNVNPQTYADLTISHFITANLIPVTLGNIVGGAVLVGLANWAIYGKTSLQQIKPAVITQTIQTTSSKEIIMNANVTVESIMDTHPVTLSPEMAIINAVDTLLGNRIAAAPVCNHQGKLVGMFSIHDAMLDLWCQDYIPAQDQTVAELMSTDVIAIDAAERLVDVTEFFCIDKEQLYPTSGMGIATRLSSLPLEARAKQIKVHKPQTLPVLRKGQFVGVVTRLQVMEALRPVYGPVAAEPVNEKVARQAVDKMIA